MPDRKPYIPIKPVNFVGPQEPPAKPEGMSWSDYAKILAGMGLRIGGAGLGAVTGGALTLGNPLGIAAGGAAGGAASEALVEKFLEPKHEVNLGRVGVGGVMGAIPGSWMIRGGNTGLSAALGAGMGYGSTVANKVAEGTPVADAVNPLSKEWSKMDVAGVGAGGVVGGLFGRFTKPHAPAAAPSNGPTLTPKLSTPPVPEAGVGNNIWPAPEGWTTNGDKHVFVAPNAKKPDVPQPSAFDSHNIRMEAERVANAKAKPMVKTVTSNIKKSLGQAQGDTRSSTTVPTSPIQAPENVELGTTPGSRFAVADPTLAETADLGPGTAFPVGPDYEGPSEATLAALGKSANKNMAKTHVTQARSAASQAGRQETAADLANTRATEGGVDLGKIDQNAAAGDIQVQMELEKAKAERMAQADAERQAGELERLRGDLTEEHDPYSISETVSGPGEHGGQARATFRRVAPPPPDEGDATAAIAGAAPVEPKGPVDPHGLYFTTPAKAKQAIIDSGNPEAYKLSRTKNNGLIKVERVLEVDPATEIPNLDLNQPQEEQTVVPPPVEVQTPPVEAQAPPVEPYPMPTPGEGQTGAGILDALSPEDPSFAGLETVDPSVPPTDIPPPPAPVPVAPKPKGPKGPKGVSGLRVGGKGKAKVPVNEVGATPVDQIVAKDAEGNIMGPHGNPQNAAELIAARQVEEDAANAVSNPVAEAQAPVSEPVVEPPVTEAPAPRTYKGVAGQFFTPADEQTGYSKTREALAGYSDEQLAKERKEFAKASFNKIFGHNAKKYLTLLDDEIGARTEGMAQAPVAETPVIAPEVGEELAAKLAGKKVTKAPIPDIERPITLNPSGNTSKSIKQQVLDTIQAEIDPADEAIRNGQAELEAKGKAEGSPRYTGKTAVTPKILKFSIEGGPTYRVQQTPEALQELHDRVRLAPQGIWETLGGVKSSKPNVKIDIPSPTWGTVEKYVPELGATHDELAKEALEAFGKRATGKLVSEAKAQYTPEELYQKLVEKGKRAPLTPEAPVEAPTQPEVPQVQSEAPRASHDDLAEAWAHYNNQRGTPNQIAKIKKQLSEADLRRMLAERGDIVDRLDSNAAYGAKYETALDGTARLKTSAINDAQGGAIPVREFYNLKKGTTQNLSPVDVAGEQYGLVKDLKKAGLATEDARREAGAEAQRLTKETVASNPSSDELAAMTPEVKDKVLKDLAKGLKKNAGQRGFIGAMPAMRLAGGATGAAIGATQTPDEPWKGALLGGAAGALAPGAIKALIGKVASNPNASEAERQGVAKIISDKVKEFGQMIPDYQRFSLLADPVNLPINVLVGPYGSAMMGAIEHAIQGDPRGLKAIKLLLTPSEFGPSTIKGAFGEAKLKIMDASERTEGQMGKAGPKWFRDLVKTPGDAMTGGDIAARNILMKAGFTPEEARDITLTAEPKTPWGQGVSKLKKGAQTEGGKKSAFINLSLPFYRTAVNQLERSMERTPVFGMWAQSWKDVPDSGVAQFAQQTFGAGVGAGSFMLGYMAPEVDPTNPAQMNLQKFVRKFLSESTGQYGNLASLAFIAGQAYKKHGTIPKAAGAVVGRLVNGDIPLPTPQPIQDAFKSALILTGNKEFTGMKDLPSGLVPGVLNPDRPGSIAQMIDLLTSDKAPAAVRGGSVRPPTGRPTYTPIRPIRK